MNARAQGRPRAVLFDWDGTLVDSWRAINQAIGETMRAFGLEPWTMEQTRAQVRHSMRNSFPKYFGDAWPKAAELFYASYARVHIEHTDALSGASKLLDHLERAGFYMAVISNKNGEYLRRESTALGWDRHFGRILGATDCALDKPAPLTVEAALEGSGIAPGPEVWYVGDADIDIELARNAGCVAVILGGGDASFPRPPDRRFADPDGLREYLAAGR